MGCAEILPKVAELNQVNNQQFGDEVSKLYYEYNICIHGNQTSEVFLILFGGIIYHEEETWGKMYKDYSLKYIFLNE